ncbi:MAG: methyltransferase domain-containing protein [Candidatus Eisenbacteria bacterium]
MGPLQDAFGHMILDYHNGDRTGREIIERDDGYFDVAGGPAAYFAEYARWLPHEKRAMQYARGRVLDVGCGAARHALHLQGKGLDVTGIDVSPLALKVSRARGLKKARLLPFTGVDPSLGTFDTITTLGNNFGLFGSPGRARWLLRKLKRMTSDGARIISESTHVYQTTNKFHLDYHRLNRRRGRMAGQTRLKVHYRMYTTPWFDYLLVSQPEMEKILEGTGWKVNRFLESGASPYIAVIEKTAD